MRVGVISDIHLRRYNAYHGYINFAVKLRKICNRRDKDKRLQMRFNADVPAELNIFSRIHDIKNIVAADCKRRNQGVDYIIVFVSYKNNYRTERKHLNNKASGGDISVMLQPLIQPVNIKKLKYQQKPRAGIKQNIIFEALYGEYHYNINDKRR